MRAKQFFRFFSPTLRKAAPKQAQSSGEGSNSNQEKVTQKPLPKSLDIAGKTYRLEPFAQGGICEILKGTPERGGAAIALKVIKHEWLGHQGVRRQFATESEVVRSFTNPSLPKYVSRGVLNSRAFLAYQFIDGQPLIDIAKQKDLFTPESLRSQALNLCRQLLEQLHYLNSKLNPVAHGDISLENIMIDGDLRLRLLDFGCAHFTNMSSEGAYQWIAKPSFLSTEQARGEHWGHRSDLYQAGILLFELLTARRWNRGKDRRDKILQAAQGQQPDVSTIAEIAGKDVALFVADLLQPDPNKRIQTAKEALERLAQLT